MSTSSTTSKAGFSWLLRMAWRDGKASRKKLVLFMASIVLGIAAVVAIQSFGENLKSNIALQSRSLMGADFKIDSDAPPNATTTSIIDSLGGADAREIAFTSMAAFPGKNGSKLMQVRGIEGGFPFYGSLETEPAEAAQTYTTKGAALVDATVLLQIGLHVGDSIKIGAVTLPIGGALKTVPGSNSFFSSVAPPVVIPYRFIEASGLVQTGSRIQYQFYFKAPNANLKQLEEQVGPQLDTEDADLDTHTATSERLGKRYENFGKFLNLVAFIALLLGCVGIASAIHIYIKEKSRTVAVLKCLGATRRQIFFIYLIQVTGMGLLGGILGTILGLLLQQLFPLFLEDLLPVDVQMAISVPAVIMGLLLGICMAVLFALYPLLSTLYISPLQALRVQETTSSRLYKTGLGVAIGILLFIFLFSFWLLQDWRYALGFVVGVLVIFALLAGMALLFIKVIKNRVPTSWGFPARQSVSNMFRPQNQTLILILAIGVGTFLISTLYFSKDLLLSQASLDTSANSMNMILLDVQTDQKEAVIKTLSASGAPVIDAIPIVTMRVESIKEIPVDVLREDTTSVINRWVLSHEFRVTYRDSMIASETLQQGTWIKKREDRANASGPIPISISDNLAKDAAITVGDLLTFNVQGLRMPVVVQNIRKVDWSRMQLNFSIVFPEGVLEKAPQFLVVTTQVENEAASAKLQQKLVQQFPTISVIDLRQVVTVIEELLGKITWLINFMAFFSIITGIIVLLGAVRTSKYQRIRESVLLRTLGARSKQVLKIVALEYLFLGILGSLSGIILSLFSSQLLAILVFEAPFVPSVIPFVILFPGITLLVLVIGVSNSLGVLKHPPLEVLRKQE